MGIYLVYQLDTDLLASRAKLEKEIVQNDRFSASILCSNFVVDLLFLHKRELFHRLYSIGMHIEGIQRKRVANWGIAREDVRFTVPGSKLASAR